MYSHEKIYQDIQEILSNDYAGYTDKKSVNNSSQYIVSNNMNSGNFEEIIHDFLLDFNDGHLWFIAKESTLPNRGFTVRRYEDVLYVTEARQE